MKTLSEIVLTNEEMGLVIGGEDSLGSSLVTGAVGAAAGAAIIGAPITAPVVIGGALTGGIIYETGQLYQSASSAISGAYYSTIGGIYSFFYTGQY